jgi:hypothetical protein
MIDYSIATEMIYTICTTAIWLNIAIFLASVALLKILPNNAVTASSSNTFVCARIVFDSIIIIAFLSNLD